MQQDGLIPPPNIQADGAFHRFPGIGKGPKNTAGWYVLNDDYGAYGDYSSDLSKGWSDTTAPATPIEKKIRDQKIAASQRQAADDLAKSYEDGAIKAAAQFRMFPLIGVSAYLTRKKIEQDGSLGVRFGKDEGDEVFIAVPRYDIDGKLWSFEKIYEDGRKSSFKGGRKKGCLHQLGTIDPGATIYVAEGFATAYSIHKATSKGVFITFGIGNLEEVTSAIKKQWPNNPIIIAGDLTDKDKTTKIADDLKCSVSSPVFNKIYDESDPKDRKDWNDLYCLEGIDVVKQQLMVEPDENLEPQWKVLSTQDFLDQSVKPREFIMFPVVQQQSLTMIYAGRGVGKTFVALNLALAIANDGSMFNGLWRSTKPASVLYVDGEMPVVSMQERISSILRNNPECRLNYSDRLHIFSNDNQKNSIPDLSTKEGRGLIEAHLEGIDLVILDNISTLCRSGKENDAESWNSMQEWQIHLRRLGKSVLSIHHAGKGGGQRGTSKREDILDTVISLKHPSDYEPEQGARFEVHYEKARGIMGDAVKTFEARLFMNQEGMRWETKTLDASLMEQVIKLKEEGLSERKIAELLNSPKTKVHRILEKAREKGLII